MSTEKAADVLVHDSRPIADIPGSTGQMPVDPKSVDCSNTAGSAPPSPDAKPVFYRRRTLCGWLAPTVRDGKRAYRAWFEDGRPVPILPYKDRRHGETCLRNSYQLRLGNP